MKKILLFLACLTSSIYSFAAHHFTVCLHNETNNTVSYNNNGISHKWKSRGELTKTGNILSNSQKCFSDVTDETIFTTHYITFTFNNTWFGIANPSSFSRPYVIAQYATNTKGGKIPFKIENGKDKFVVHIHAVNKHPGFVITSSGNINDTDSLNIITPRKFK